jgi:hypothetical protein
VLSWRVLLDGRASGGRGLSSWGGFLLTGRRVAGWHGLLGAGRLVDMGCMWPWCAKLESTAG